MDQMRDIECTLLTASCTTGWSDWIHGELWLCPDGLLRRALGLGATMAHGTLQTVDPSTPVRRRLTSEEIAAIGGGRRNRWIRWDSIARAELRSGPLTHSLHLELRDGTRQKLLWLGVDPARARLADVLPSVLGERFVAGKGKDEPP